MPTDKEIEAVAIARCHREGIAPIDDDGTPNWWAFSTDAKNDLTAAEQVRASEAHTDHDGGYTAAALRRGLSGIDD